MNYMLEYLLNTPGYVRLSDFCDVFFVSKTVLSNDIKKLRKILEDYHLKLISRPNYGTKVEGNEFDIRLCIASRLSSCFGGGFAARDQETIQKIARIVSQAIEKEDYSISQVNLDNLITHIYVTLQRVISKEIIVMDNDTLAAAKTEGEYGLAQRIMKSIGDTFEIEIPEAETAYICIHLAGKKILSEERTSADTNLVVTPEVSSLVQKMLYAIHSFLKMDFSNDLDLKMTLMLHLVPFLKRLQYGMTSRNPLLHHIKTRYILAYDIAVIGCDVIKNEYKKMVSEDEIGYFALIFSLSLVRKHPYHKKNIILVCATGRGTSQMLYYRFREEFEKYLNIVEVCDLNELKQKDFGRFDYVFTTVFIPYAVPIPIFEIETFFDIHEVFRIQHILKQESDFPLDKYFGSELFLADLTEDNKLDLIKKMVDITKEAMGYEEDLLPSILQREKMGNTEFGKGIALPHTDKVMTKKTAIAAAVLPEPILWNENKVQIVFLIIVGKDGGRDIQKLFKVLSQFIFNQELVQELLQTPKYAAFLEIMQKCSLDADLYQ